MLSRNVFKNVYSLCLFRITCLKIPLQSKWVYIGTERGNIHVVNLDSFQLSGYIVNWNKAIEL